MVHSVTASVATARSSGQGGSIYTRCTMNVERKGREGGKGLQYFHRLVTSGNSLASFGRSYLNLGLAGPPKTSACACWSLFPRSSFTTDPAADGEGGIYPRPASCSGETWCEEGRALDANVSPLLAASASGKRRSAELRKPREGTRTWRVSVGRRWRRAFMVVGLSNGKELEGEVFGLNSWIEISWARKSGAGNEYMGI